MFNRRAVTEDMPSQENPWVVMLRATPRRRGLLTLASALAAVFLGFLAFSPVQAQSLVHDYGYYLIASTLVWFVLSLLRVWRETRAGEPLAGCIPTAIWRRPRIQAPLGWAVLAVAGTSILCVIAEAPREKILYDEHVLQATAMHMHLTRDVSTVVRGYDVNGVFLPMNYYLDKRPYFFALLLSLVHDVTGYRLANVYWLNGGLTVFTLAMLYVVTRRLANHTAGIFAVLLFGTLPLLAQNSSGAGMEVLNIAMILTCIWLGMLALERPSTARLGAFVLGVVLLAQTRYESALYVIAAGLVLSAIWWREKQIILPWEVVFAPVLLVPIPLLQLVVSANRVMWDLPQNLDSRFGVVHLRENLEHAVAFFSSFSREQPNSVLLVLLGLAGVAGCAWQVARKPERLLTVPGRWVAACFSLIILGNLGLLMFYFWGALDDPLVSRLALPFYALLTCAAAVWSGFLDRRIPATRWGIVAALVAIPLTYGRATPLHLYTSQNLTAAEIRWEQQWIAARPSGDRLVITNKSSLPWLLERKPALLLGIARDHVAQLAFHLREGTFAEILVMQRLRPTTLAGDLAVDAEDRMPPCYQLEPLAEKRFGITLDRISRLTAVELPDSTAASP